MLQIKRIDGKTFNEYVTKKQIETILSAFFRIFNKFKVYN